MNKAGRQKIFSALLTLLNSVLGLANPYTGASMQQSLARGILVPFAHTAQDANTLSTATILRQ